jgi:DNA modification methylase
LAYLIHMTLRVTEIYRVLKPTGSFYLHCDPTASHYLKLILDAVFVSQGGDYRNEIIWRRINSKGLAFTRFASNHDTVFYYTKTTHRTWNSQYSEHNKDYVEAFYRFVEPETNRRYTLDNLANPNKDRPNLTYEFLGVTRVWRWTKERMQKAYDEGLIIQSNPGSVPRLKRFLDEQEGNPVDDLWTDIPPISSQAAERMGYPTQKPEALMDRIIKASSNAGDVVLDAYCGCGTTIAVAQRMNRKWIGIDITYHSISLMLKRLIETFGESVLDNVFVEGIPKDLESARALANRQDDRVRKEFEKWAALTYTNNRGVINEKKGADKGIDAIVYFAASANETGRMIIQVKSGSVNRGAIATLHGDLERERAEMATLITLENPTGPMIEEAKKAGTFEHKIMGKKYDRIQIVTVQELIEQDRRIDLPLSFDVLKQAVKSKNGSQMDLGIG